MGFNTAITAAMSNVKNHGYKPALYDIGVRIANRIIAYRCLQCVVIETPDPRFKTLPEQFQYRVFRPNEIEVYARSSEYELDDDFLRVAAEKGDECHAILSGNVLASYGWYSRQPTNISGELGLDFDHNYIYMYKGFTHRSFRGHRLHAIGMTLALAHYRSIGRKGLVSYVEAQNYDSLKSCYRMGYRACGQIRYFAVGKKYVIFPDADCKALGLRLYHVPARAGQTPHYRTHVNNG